MRRIIFLDIDGVLNSTKFFVRSKGSSAIDRECVERLNTLSDLNPEIVISSSWGDHDGKTSKELKKHGLKIKIIGCTQHFAADYLCRGNEIEKWIIDNLGGMGTKFGTEYRNRNYKYVILDDDMDMLLGQGANFIRVDRDEGLTDEDIEVARKILM